MDNSDFSVLLWDASLETGVSWIDDQHKQLLQHIENLVVAIARKKGEDKVRELISFLRGYIHTHFITEQNFMQRFNYPQAAAHYGQHDHFAMKFKELEKKYLQSGPSRLLAVEIASELWEWYKDHICKYDKKLAVFLKVRKANAERSHKIPPKKSPPQG